MLVNTKPMRDKIIELCKKDPSLADDDIRLIANVWWQEGWHDKELCKHLRSVSSPETIRRTRAKLVQDGTIKPSCATQAARKVKEQKTRGDLGY